MKFLRLEDGHGYSEMSVGLACGALAAGYGMDYESLPRDQFVSRASAGDPTVAVVLFEAANLAKAHLTVRSLRRAFPNARVVAVGSDTVFWLAKGQDEYDSPADVDLHLDTMRGPVGRYRERGITADLWWWTISETLLAGALAYDYPPPGVRPAEFVALWGVGHADQYRNRVRDQMVRCGVKVVGAGACDYSLPSLRRAYQSARFTLGTTSPSWTAPHRTMKGFRDWVGPALGTPLIYDDHPEVGGWPVPVYEYDRPETAARVAYREYLTDWEGLLRSQREWLAVNTIDRQLRAMFERCGIVSGSEWQIGSQ